MPLQSTNPTTAAAWKLLEENFKETKGLQLKDLFVADKERTTKLIPADFIGFKDSLNGDSDHYNKLMANFLHRPRH